MSYAEIKVQDFYHTCCNEKKNSVDFSRYRFGNQLSCIEQLAPPRQRMQLFITKTRLFKYTENFTPKNENFQTKNPDIFHTSPQNIDCGYSVEPPR